VFPRGVRSGFCTWLNDAQWRPSMLGAFLRFVLQRPVPLDISHLMPLREADAMGPVQQCEALFLFAITKVLQPRIILEFGFNRGQSARNFLAAAPSTAEVHSFDISPHSAAIARQLSYDKRLHFHHKSQADFIPGDIGHRKADLVFIDASHDLLLNQETWKRLTPCLNDNCVVVVHDTGTWARGAMRDMHFQFAASPPTAAGWVSADEFAHQLDERRFVNWICDSDPSFNIIHLHTTQVLRHGLSLLQRTHPLRTDVTLTQPQTG